MARKFSKFDRIDCNQSITQESHYDFLYHLQSTLLLSLREQGRLTPMQHRYAQEKLSRQRRERGKRKQERL